MYRLPLLSCALLALSPAALAGSKNPADDHVLSALRKDIPSLMQQAGVPGLSVALIRNGKTYSLQNYGVKKADTQDAVTDGTVFNIGSLSKPVFAYGVLKLVDAGKLKLDEPIASYLRNEETIDDPRFRQITARIILSHRTGFPNWPGDGQPLTIHFTPGERFSYSGAGMVLLSKAVEHITGKPLNDYMQEAVFNPLGMTSSSYIWRSAYDSTVAIGHESNGAPVAPFKAKEANAAASLETTTHDYALFVEAVLAGKGLKPATLRQMETPQIAVDPECTNCTDTVPKQRSKSVFWGLGWGIEQTPQGESLWHWGDNGVYKAWVEVRLKTKDAVIIFTNSANGLAIARSIVNDALGGDQPAFDWLKYDNYDSASFKFSRAIDRDSAADVLKAFTSDLNSGAISENTINLAGYTLLYGKKAPADAILVFRKNVQLHPDSWNAYDSLAEGYLKDGQKDLAIKNYEKSLQLNPNNSNGADALKKLQDQQP